MYVLSDENEGDLANTAILFLQMMYYHWRVHHRMLQLSTLIVLDLLTLGIYNVYTFTCSKNRYILILPFPLPEYIQCRS